MKRQRFDIGYLVEYDDAGSLSRQGLVLERRPIKPDFYNTDRDYHVDEYRCKIKFIDTESEEPRWVRAKWLKLLSQARE